MRIIWETVRRITHEILGVKVLNGDPLHCNDWNILMLSNVKKNKMWWESDLMKHFQWKNLLLASLICLQHFNFHGKCFFLKGEIQKFLKLLEISCLQVRNSKLIIIIMLHIIHLYMLVCITTIVDVSFKIFFGVAVVLCWSL